MSRCSPFLSITAVLAFAVVSIVSNEINLNRFSFSFDPTQAAEALDDSNTSSVPSVPFPSELPTCQDGCVIFFLHIPKTGGQALGKTLKWSLQSKGVTYSYQVAKNFRQHQLSNWRNATRLCSLRHRKRILVLELHTNNAPTFQSLVQEGFFDHLQKTTESCGLPLFSFTLLRESVSLEVSLFNHLCLQSRRCDNPEQPTVENLVDFHPGNPQCHFLKGWPTSNRLAKTNYTREDCNGTYTSLTKYMDWIGALERYNDTIAVLEHVTQQPLEQVVWNQATDHDVFLKRHHLNDTVVQGLQDDSAWDRSFYDRVANDYTLERFGLAH